MSIGGWYRRRPSHRCQAILTLILRPSIAWARETASSAPRREAAGIVQASHVCAQGSHLALVDGDPLGLGLPADRDGYRDRPTSNSPSHRLGLAIRGTAKRVGEFLVEQQVEAGDPSDGFLRCVEHRQMIRVRKKDGPGTDHAPEPRPPSTVPGPRAGGSGDRPRPSSPPVVHRGADHFRVDRRPRALQVLEVEEAELTNSVRAAGKGDTLLLAASRHALRRVSETRAAVPFRGDGLSRLSGEDRQQLHGSLAVQ